MKTAVAYYRMSTGKQDTSIDGQRTEVEKYANANGYKIVGEYIDEAISGDKTEKRTAFLQMRDAVTSKRFGYVLCWDQDRFGRFNLIEGGYWIKPFLDAGVELVTVAQGLIDWTDFAGRTVWAVQQEAKHAYLQDLSRNVLRGMMAGVKEGRVQSRAPFGYVTTNGKLALGDPDKVELVREIFRRYAHPSTSRRSIYVDFCKRNIAGPSGGDWDPATIGDILRNEAYIGNTVWNRRHSGKYHGVRAGEIQKTQGNTDRGKQSKANWIRVDGTHPAIIDRKTWDIVQFKLASAKRSPRTYDSTYLFSGLIRCGQCGGSLNGRTAGGPECYQCCRYTRLGKRACTPNRIVEAELLDLVIRKLHETVLDSSNVERLKAAMRKRLLGDGGQIETSQRRLGKLNKDIERLAKRLRSAPDDVADVIIGEIQQAKRERTELEGRISAMQVSSKQADLGIDKRITEAATQLWALRRSLPNADRRKVRDWLSAVIQRIDVKTYQKHRTGRHFVRDGLIHFRLFSNAGFGKPCPTLETVRFTDADMRRTG